MNISISPTDIKPKDISFFLFFYFDYLYLPQNMIRLVVLYFCLHT